MKEKNNNSWKHIIVKWFLLWTVLPMTIAVYFVELAVNQGWNKSLSEKIGWILIFVGVFGLYKFILKSIKKILNLK